MFLFFRDCIKSRICFVSISCKLETKWNSTVWFKARSHRNCANNFFFVFDTIIWKTFSCNFIVVHAIASVPCESLLCNPFTGGSKRGCQGHVPPSPVQFFSILCSFREQMAKVIGLRYHHGVGGKFWIHHCHSLHLFFFLSLMELSRKRDFNNLTLR